MVLFKAGEGEGGEEEEWHPTSITSLPGTRRRFNSHFPDSPYGVTNLYDGCSILETQNCLLDINHHCVILAQAMSYGL